MTKNNKKGKKEVSGRAKTAQEIKETINKYAPETTTSSNYHYSFSDLFHRMNKETFFYRVYISNYLYNRLN